MIEPVRRGDARTHVALAVASVLVAATLFLPRPTNFAPLGAFGLFVGAYAPGRRSWAYPLAALAIYVVGIGGYDWLVLGSVVLGFAGPAFIGARYLAGRVSPRRLGGGALASSVWFFLVSNLGSWAVFGVPRGEGLVAHYMIGLPFFWNTLAGDAFFTAVLFGVYALVAPRHREEPRSVGPRDDVTGEPAPVAPHGT